MYSSGWDMRLGAISIKILCMSSHIWNTRKEYEYLRVSTSIVYLYSSCYVYNYITMYYTIMVGLSEYCFMEARTWGQFFSEDYNSIIYYFIGFTSSYYTHWCLKKPLFDIEKCNVFIYPWLEPLFRPYFSC